MNSDLRDKVVPVLLLLETTEGHLGTRNVLLGVLEVLEEGLVVPLDALLLVGIGVGVTLDGAGLAAPKTVKSGTDLVATVLVDGVALRATRLEEVGTLLEITCYVRVSVLFGTQNTAGGERGCDVEQGEVAMRQDGAEHTQELRTWRGPFNPGARHRIVTRQNGSEPTVVRRRALAVQGIQQLRSS